MVTSTLGAVGEAHRDLGAAHRLAEPDLEPVADIAAAHPHGAPAAAAAEQVLDHVLEVGCVLERAGAGIAGAARPFGKVTVELLAHLRRAAGVDLAAIELAPLLLVGQQLVGGGALLEPLLRLLVAGMQVGMRGLGELAIGAADLVRGRVTANAQHLVGIAHAHLASLARHAFAASRRRRQQACERASPCHLAGAMSVSLRANRPRESRYAHRQLVVTAAFLLASGAAMACPMQSAAKNQTVASERQQHPDPGEDLDRPQRLSLRPMAGPLRSAVHRTLGCDY